MNTICSASVAVFSAVILLPCASLAGTHVNAFSCKGVVPSRDRTDKRLLRTVVFPFRALGWAMYYTMRAPGRVTEIIAFGETGEDVAYPVQIAPRLDWRFRDEE